MILNNLLDFSLSIKMTSAEVNPSHFSSTLSTHAHLSSPLPKRSRLSLRRTTQFLNKPCYKEDDSLDTTKKTENLAVEPRSIDDLANIEMIDLTRDEKLKPNCSSPKEEEKTEPVATDGDAEEEDVKVWTLGLPNCGNTCFVNSILQVLRYTPVFLNSLHSLLLAHHQIRKASTNEEETKEIMFFKYMHSLYTVMKRKEALMRVNLDKDYCSSLLKPVKSVIRSLREVNVLFEEGEQHDAHELLITTISAFSTACQSLKNQMPSSAKQEEEKPSTSVLEASAKASLVPPAEKDLKKQASSSKKRKANVSLDTAVELDLNLGFEGRIRHVVQCLECDKKLERDESFANLEVNIPEWDPDEDKDRDSVDLIECLSQTTILSGENKFFCEECLRYNEARINSEVITLPPILLLHFSWLRQTQEISDVEKTSIKVIIPRLFQTSENPEVFCCSPDQTYKLFAVVLHIGRSTEGGHYVTFIKDAYQDIVIEDKKPLPKFRSSQFTTEIEQCCMTDEITNFKTIDATTKWLLFDDDVVSPVCIEDEDDSKSFPYFNYLSITASPCLIFYHKI
ncbi:hypothetical protein JTE90_003251 [Oedothorax gibbosus]|uniref:Ubiquitin carboxyl-terminal hydrolase n=1 Tax=Oedothorax gibbosus TaxID=931172 RepID=A0AAV6V686_9ARAC|nr:hypothetical protein JTE90_003251 [Oedothorax gibbosus]